MNLRRVCRTARSFAQRLRSFAQRLLGAALPLLAVALAGCNRGILDPIGPVGSAEKTILINSTAIMLAIIIPTMIATVAFAWWFRSGNTKATYRPDWEYSGAVEMVVWAIPALTVILLGGIAWIGSHDLEPSKPLRSPVQPLKVETFPYEWSNAVGGKFTSGGATARFPMDLPAGELDVVVVSANGAYQRTLKAKDREKVR